MSHQTQSIQKSAEQADKALSTQATDPPQASEVPEAFEVPQESEPAQANEPPDLRILRKKKWGQVLQYSIQ